MTDYSGYNDDMAFEKAAKYVCTYKCGLCPMVVEQFPCPKECDLETKAWQCWMIFFRSISLQEKQAK